MMSKINEDQLAELILEEGYVSEENLNNAKKFVREHNTTLVQHLLQEELITEDVLGKLVAEKDLSYPYTDLNIQRNALDSINEGITITDPSKEDNPIIYANSGFEKLTGYDKKEIIGRNCRFLQGEDTSQEIVKEIAASIEDKEYFRGVLKNYKKSGELFWNELSISPIYDYKGDVTHFVGVQRDITEIKQKESQLKKKKAHSAAMLYSVGEGLVVFDKECKIDFVNKAFEKILLKDKPKIKGQIAHEVLSIKNKSKNKVDFESSMLKKVLKEGREVRNNKGYYLVRDDDSLIPVSITISPIELNEEIIGAIGVFRDITSIKEAEKAKNNFMSLVSYQLRTPLTTMRWATETLVDEGTKELSEKQRMLLDKVMNSTKRMADVINALINMSRIKSDSLRIKNEEVNLVNIIQDAIETLRPEIEKKNLELSERYDSDIPFIKSDSNILLVIFQILISNAIEYSLENKSMGIETTAKDKKEVIEIEIWSKVGDEITKKSEKNLFKDMLTKESIKHEGYRSSDVGLYVAKTVINKIGAEIWFEAEGKKKGCFYIQIPYKGTKEQGGSEKLVFGNQSSE